MRRFYHQELEDFRASLHLMAEKGVEIVRLALYALRDQDMDACQRVLALDDELDELEVELDQMGIRYISLRAPVARELRLLTAGMKAGHDLERIGDEACTIAKRTARLLNQFPYPNLGRIPQMGELAFGMLRDAASGFITPELELMEAMPDRDLAVDQLNREIYQRLANDLAVSPEQVKANLDLIFVNKSIERIADHATNLAEEVIYLHRGEDVRHPKAGSTLRDERRRQAI